MGLLNALLEDYGDEWLTKAMFHYRWYYAEDIELAGAVLPHYADVTQTDETLQAMKQIFSERQINRLYVVGSNDTTAPVIEASYQRCLEALNAHLKHQPFYSAVDPPRQTLPSTANSPSLLSLIQPLKTHPSAVSEDSRLGQQM